MVVKLKTPAGPPGRGSWRPAWGTLPGRPFRPARCPTSRLFLVRFRVVAVPRAAAFPLPGGGTPDGAEGVAVNPQRLGEGLHVGNERLALSQLPQRDCPPMHAGTVCQFLLAQPGL